MIWKHVNSFFTRLRKLFKLRMYDMYKCLCNTSFLVTLDSFLLAMRSMYSCLAVVALKPSLPHRGVIYQIFIPCNIIFTSESTRQKTGKSHLCVPVKAGHCRIDWLRLLLSPFTCIPPYHNEANHFVK